jgi:predicted DNA-binding transcriptional regulator YafY
MPPSESSPFCKGYTDLAPDERRHHLIEWLRSGHKLTASYAADLFGVSRRTVIRDLQHLRDVLELDISFDSSLETYTLAEEHSALSFLAFPSVVPILLNGEVAPLSETPSLSPNAVHLRFSAREIQAYIARGGSVPEELRNDDDSLDIYFTPHNLDEFIGYVLSRGHHIEVLGPNDVRRRVQMEIRRMLAIYEPEPPATA